MAILLEPEKLLILSAMGRGKARHVRVRSFWIFLMDEGGKQMWMSSFLDNLSLVHIFVIILCRNDSHLYTERQATVQSTYD